MRPLAAATPLPVALAALLAGACGDDPRHRFPDGGGASDAARLADAPAPDAPPVDADAAPDAAPDAGAPVVPDPAPGVDAPGAHGGPGCPTSAETAFTLDAWTESSRLFAGTVTGTGGAGGPVGDGVFWVSGPAGERVGGALETAADGTYAKTLPLFCGANTVKLVWPSSDCTLAVVYAVTRTGCEAADLTATLQWDALGRDFELHLVKPGGRINDQAMGTDCTWTTCIGASPDWGVIGDPADDPHKDIDNTGAYGPENVWLRGPEAGTYTVMVEHWGSSGDPQASGSVTLNVAGHVTVVTIPHLAPEHVWTAATIAWPSGVVTPRQDDHDCTASWSSGCLDPLP